ncbi:MAG TPA: hypothetical protein VHF51_02620 [Solirubrobacteraceae bacterium]|nr:hypothetical protein [Solirubrobacteraceae bacterium]
MRALGDAWEETVAEFHAERAAAAVALGEARARQGAQHPDLPDPRSLRAAWPSLSPVERRELYAVRFDTVATWRDSDGMLRLAVFAAGHGPGGLSRRGFNRAAGLHPIDVPADARVLALEDPRERARDRAG